MNRKKTIHDLLQRISIELLEFIKEEESSFDDRGVPAVHINKSLELKFFAVPRANQQQRKKDWLFAILARMLEDKDLIKYKKDGNRAFYKSV